MAAITPSVREQMQVIRRIVENGARGVLDNPKDTARRLDDWQHLHDELRFLQYLMIQG